MKPQQTKILAFIIVAAIAAWFLYQRQPALTEKQKQWILFHRNVDTKDPDYPLEVLEDGYKMIRVGKREARTIKGTEIPASVYVEWGWKLTVRNRSSKSVRVSVR